MFDGDRTVLPSLLMVVLGKLQPDFLQRINEIISGCASSPLAAGDFDDEDGMLSGNSDPVRHLITLYSVTSSFMHSVNGMLALEGAAPFWLCPKLLLSLKRLQISIEHCSREWSGLCSHRIFSTKRAIRSWKSKCCWHK